MLYFLKNQARFASLRCYQITKNTRKINSNSHQKGFQTKQTNLPNLENVSLRTKHTLKLKKKVMCA